VDERSPDDDFLEDDEEAQQETFTPRILDKTVIAVPLLNELKEEKRQLREGLQKKPERHAVVIDINLEYREGRAAARERTKRLVEESAVTSR
jgi:serine protease AprX